MPKNKKTKPIITSLVLINLHISHDTGRRNIKSLSKKIAQENDADEKSINTSIKMIAPDKIREFTVALSRCRTYYLEKSLPWEDGNWRVIPVSKFQGFKDDLETLISEAKDSFEKCFIKNYDVLKTDSERRQGKLGLTFPSKGELEESFSIKYNVGAVASAEDIRIVGIDSAMRQRIVKETQDRYNEKIDEGLNGLATGLINSLDELSERVGADDQKGKKYSRFLENLKEMTETVEGLNITKNSILEEACSKIRKEISCWSPEAIKADKKVRDSIKESAGSTKEELAQVTIEDDD